MISARVISKIALLASKLNKAGYALEPVPHLQTPLGELVKQCLIDTPEIGLNVNQLDNPDQALGLIYDSIAKPNGLQPCTHSDVMGKSIELAVNGLTSAMAFARTVVIPFIREAITDIDKAISDQVIDAAKGMNIVQDSFEAIWDAGAIEELIENYTNVSMMNDVHLMKIFPLLTEAEVRDLTKTGISRFDKLVDELTDAIGIDKVVDIYRQVFVNSQALATNGAVDVMYDSSQPLYRVIQPMAENRIVALYTHLMARRLLNNPPNIDGLSLSGYEADMAGIVNQTGLIISKILAARESAKKEGRLVISYPMFSMAWGYDSGQIDDIIHVNKEVYVKWLEEGGTPEALFGAAVSQDRLYHANGLLENRDKLESKWARHLSQLVEYQTTNKINVTLEAIGNVITDKIAALDDSQGWNKGVMHEILQREIRNVHIHDLHDQSAVWRICARILHPQGGAEHIVMDLRRVETENPKLTMKEIADIVAVGYLAKYIASQFHIVKLR